MKLIFIVITWFEAFLMGLLPVVNKRFTDSPKCLGLANSFSGGIFIAIALMHIMPEQAAAWTTYMATKEKKPAEPATLNEGGGLPLIVLHGGDGDEGGFPLPFLLMLSGYTLILLVDKVLFDTHATFGHAHGEDHVHGHGPDHNHGILPVRSASLALKE